jgi:hypothetical protein
MFQRKFYHKNVSNWSIPKYSIDCFHSIYSHIHCSYLLTFFSSELTYEKYKRPKWKKPLPLEYVKAATAVSMVDCKNVHLQDILDPNKSKVSIVFYKVIK